MEKHEVALLLCTSVSLEKKKVQMNTPIHITFKFNWQREKTLKCLNVDTKSCYTSFWRKT